MIAHLKIKDSSAKLAEITHKNRYKQYFSYIVAWANYIYLNTFSVFEGVSLSSKKPKAKKKDFQKRVARAKFDIYVFITEMMNLNVVFCHW